MEAVVDFLTQQWKYGPEVCLAAFALFHSARVKKTEKDGGKPLFWAESLVLTFMMVFGGGIIAPFLLGKPPVIFVNDLLVPLVAMCWFVSNRAEGTIFTLINAPLMKEVIVVLAECFRANSICSVVILSNEILKAGKHYPIPFWGPIFLGTIAGCGGMFLPLDKGLKGLKNGAPWPLQSAFYGSVFFNVMAFDPNAGPYLRDGADKVLGGIDTVVQAKAIVAAFFCVVAVGQAILGPSFNPFTPIHDIVYTISRVPKPQATTSSKKKSKGD